VPRAADGEGANRILVRPRLAAHDGAGLAGLKAWDLSAAWWRTPGGCAAAGDGAGRTVAASAGMKARTCPLPDDVDPGAVPLPGMGRARWGCLG